MHFEHKTYFVYIMSNRSQTLYTGITNSLYRRVRQHKDASGSEFTARYKLDRLVYFERFDDVHRAIGREKQIKGLLRIKKIALIVSVNPCWRDLSEAGTNAINSSQIMHRSFGRGVLRKRNTPLPQDDNDGVPLPC